MSLLLLWNLCRQRDVRSSLARATDSLMFSVAAVQLQEMIRTRKRYQVSPQLLGTTIVAFFLSLIQRECSIRSFSRTLVTKSNGMHSKQNGDDFDVIPFFVASSSLYCPDLKAAQTCIPSTYRLMPGCRLFLIAAGSISK